MATSFPVRSREFGSVRAAAAKHVLNDTLKALSRGSDMPGPQMPQASFAAFAAANASDFVQPQASARPICIVGAGCAGLYAAMILDSLKIPYEILEANDRVGGRIYTHRFNGEAGRDAPVGDPARYDYIDIGAMRYPKIEFMDRVFKLFNLLKMDDKGDNLLIEYKYSASHTFEHYNGVRYNTSDPVPLDNHDIFGVSEANHGAVPNEFVAKGVDKVAEDIFKPYADAFRDKPFAEAWAELAKEDMKSTRAYLLEKFPETVVEWLETFQSATGLYNESFVESVMDAMDFGSSSAKRDGKTGAAVADFAWYCIDGGSDHLTSRMADYVQSKPVLNTRVTKMESVGEEMKVTYIHGGEVKEEMYSQIICTVPLGCLAAIDIPKKSNGDPTLDDLSYMQRQAIRSLNYDTSTKVALRFSSRWWEDPAVMGDRPIKGGISSSDLAIRTCVYPSYGFTATSPVPGVMLASYTWAQDAQRIGGLAQGKGTQADERLIELTLKNLSDMHGVPVEKFGPLVDHYAYNWHNDEFARGAFALFGPGQFGNGLQGSTMFASMKAAAAGGKLHIAGEATSVHHAWVLGALNSAWRAVFNALAKYPDEKREELEDKWEVPDEEDTRALLMLSYLSRKQAI